MNLASRHWLSAILLTVLALLPSSASAGMTPEEVKTFQVTKADAEKGTASAQFVLGLLYDMGKGVAKDEVEAVTWYRKAADQGRAEAQYNLADFYLNGKGVAKDAAEAVKWYRKAADQGHADAQYNLGYSYYSGEGVAKDEIEAYAYWSLARTTNEDARKNLAILEKGMSPDARIRGQQRTKELQKVIEADMAAKKDALMKALYPGLKKSGK